MSNRQKPENFSGRQKPENASGRQKPEKKNSNRSLLEGREVSQRKSSHRQPNSMTPSRQASSSLTPSRRRGTEAQTAQTEDKAELKAQSLKASLKQFAFATVEKGVQGLLTEFNDLKTETSTPPAKTAFDANQEKNRYKDVLCTDETRVVLKWPPGAENNYIHANYVLVRGRKKFICTQGPTDKTVDDFWRMIWQEKCRSIVMLCRVVENGKKKCEPYYPENPNDTMTTSSNVAIKNTGMIDSEKIFTISTLEVSVEGETIIVKHLLWNEWPDRGVPQNIMACLRLLAQLKGLSPTVVHCSAGIGRTGTIVGLEFAQQAILSGEILNLPQIVKDLRSQRHGSVQTDVQYIYMHRVMIGLAENKKVIKREELAQFLDQYEAFMKSRGC